MRFGFFRSTFVMNWGLILGLGCRELAVQAGDGSPPLSPATTGECRQGWLSAEPPERTCRRRGYKGDSGDCRSCAAAHIARGKTVRPRKPSGPNLSYSKILSPRTSPTGTRGSGGRYARWRSALGHSAWQAPVLVQLPKPSSSILATIAFARRAPSTRPCGSLASDDTRAATNNIADPFLQVAAQAPQPTQAAASIDSSASACGIGMALRVGHRVGAYRDEASGLQNLVVGRAVHHEVLDDGERRRAPRLDGDRRCRP